ncbi:MAG: hypothetical protein KIT19_09360 [Phycisphaeraceae bacterium]|nr:hypothetical protein [Phycisphaeraceae bacterium]
MAERHTGVSRLVWRAWGAPVVVFVCVTVFASALFPISVPGVGWTIAAVAGVCVIVGAPIVVAAGSRRYTLARARAYWYRICPACGADLRRCDDAGACPACAAAYTHDVLLRHWERTDSKSARAKRWRPLTARGVFSPVFLMAIAPMVLGLGAAWFLVSTGVLPRSMAMMGFIVIGPMMGVLGTLVGKRDRRDFERIEKGGFLTCPECLVELPALSDAEKGEACCFGPVGGAGFGPGGVCGQRYSQGWLEETWKGSYAHVVGGKGTAGGGFGVDRGSQRLAMWFGVVALVVVGVLALLNPMVGFMSLHPAVLGALGAALVVGLLVFAVLLVKRSGSHYTRMIRLRAHGYRFCPECGYDLRESAAEGMCPECGVGYDAESLRTRWERGARVEPPEI